MDVPVVLDPPWTSDRIAPEARERMKKIGLAPPPPAGRFQADIPLSASLGAVPEEVAAATCPFCGSENTELEGPFGPTICRSLHYCHDCQQPFESFKPL